MSYFVNSLSPDFHFLGRDLSYPLWIKGNLGPSLPQGVKLRPIGVSINFKLSWAPSLGEGFVYFAAVAVKGSWGYAFPVDKQRGKVKQATWGRLADRSAMVVSQFLTCLLLIHDVVSRYSRYSAGKNIGEIQDLFRWIAVLKSKAWL